MIVEIFEKLGLFRVSHKQYNVQDKARDISGVDLHVSYSNYRLSVMNATRSYQADYSSSKCRYLST